MRTLTSVSDVLGDTTALAGGGVADSLDSAIDTLTVQADLDRIADDARALSAVLLDTRLEMQAAERVLSSASVNAASASESVESIRTDIDTYGGLARVGVAAVSIALLAGTSAPLLMGRHLRRTAD